MNAKTLARGLGWFSICVGLTELIAPRVLARVLGMSEERVGLLRAFALREIAAGVGILMSRARPTPWVWARVGGDVMDIVVLGKAMKDSSKKGSVGFALSNVLAATAVDALCARRLNSSLA